MDGNLPSAGVNGHAPPNCVEEMGCELDVESKEVVMIDFRVSIDDSLVDACQAVGLNGYCEAVDGFCTGEPSLAKLKSSDLIDLRRASAHLDDSRLREIANYLWLNKERSVAHITKFLPSLPNPLQYPLLVKLLPFGLHNFAARGGLQIFSVHPEADPVEAYLFLVHVYYHELSTLFYTEKCRRCSSTHRDGEDFFYWIKLLVRNEAIANYAVLDELNGFMREKPSYDFRYFTYAKKINDEQLIKRSISALDTTLDNLTSADVESRAFSVIAGLKSKLLPVINLLGIHMASAIAEKLGLDTLVDVYKKDAHEFFARYAETGSIGVGRLGRMTL